MNLTELVQPGCRISLIKNKSNNQSLHIAALDAIIAVGYRVNSYQALVARVIEHYHLEAVFAVGYPVRSARGTQLSS